MSSLYIVATPIGNLEDITLRALRVLGEVDFILAEDTRVTRKLLDKYEIKTPLISYHQHSGTAKVEQICRLCKENKDLALVSDAGTPGISDPGNKLVEYLLRCSALEEMNIVPVPGPSVVSAILSVCGFAADNFVFFGFPPHKKGRNNFFRKVAEEKRTVVFYESCHRIVKCLEAIKDLVGMRDILVGNDLTKKFEKIYRGKAVDILDEIKKDSARGEYVVVLGWV